MSAARTAAEVNRLLEAAEPSACLGYLSLVNGIDGAVLFDHQGWAMATGEETTENLLLEAPYFLFHFQEVLRNFQELGLEPLESQVAFGGAKFYLVLNLERESRFFLVVSGARGSYDLFKYRVDRGAQAIVGLLHGRGYFRS